MVADLKHSGTVQRSSDLLKISANTGASWSAQVLRTEGDTPSGPGALRVFCFLKKERTVSSETEGAEDPGSGPPEAEGAWGPKARSAYSLYN